MAPPSPPAPSVLNARYIAIRTAEGRGLNERLLQAARDRTPGVRRLLVPMLYRVWHRDHEQGWHILTRIGDDMIRFPGLLDGFVVETFAEFSLAILNGCRGDTPQLDRLAAIWRVQIERIFATPLARTFGRRWVLKMLAKPVAGVLKRQPAYQPLNFQELEVVSARPPEFREAWRAGLACLEHPEQGLDPVAAILGNPDLPFDLYLMLLCERTLIYHGVKIDPAGTFALLERLFAQGCPWFRQSVLYVLFHQLGNLPEVDNSWLDRYAEIAETFFASGAWRMRSTVAQYNFAGHLAWPELIIDRWAPATAPRILPGLLKRAVAGGDAEQIDGLFRAIDTIAFSHGRAPLALTLLERSLEIGGAAIEERVLASLATVRLQDQPLVDAFLDEHRDLARLRPRLEGAAPTIQEEDMPSLLDGLTVQLILNSDYFRGRVCDAFRNAASARSTTEFLVQILEWLRDEFSRMTPA